MLYKKTLKMVQVEEIITELDSFHYNDGDWLPLDRLIIKLWNTGKPEVAIQSLFKIFEKYPTEDGAGVFWTILHGIESLNYEKELYDSLIRKPSYMVVIMLNRIENSNSKTIAGKSIAKFKELLRNHSKINSELLDYLN
ncbi:hypothetical protein A9Q93_02180 [Nonlabens dokdonensis]|uniref:Uncharacterized protein n=2 Tax=Nonlabens dokdonensis TaxID=328515 RepID=A0A1Z8BB39_9FLAO|nr:hypothetical protein A9Q93_02180 [Nonlabens dokdonensis]